MMPAKTRLSPAESCARMLLDDPVGAVIFGLVLLVSCYIHFSSPINHDTAWYLYSVNAYMDGGQLYDDVFFEVNPPLAFYLAMPPVILSRVAGIFSPPVLTAYVLLLIGLSLLLIRSLSQGVITPRFQRGLLFAAMLALVVLPLQVFTQREHLLLILSLPYLVLAARRASGAECHLLLAAATGVLGGLGFALKPHFLLVPAAVELYLLFRRSRLRGLVRPETVALVATIGLYGLAVIAFTPDYLTRVVPFALETYNSAFKTPFLDVFWRLETPLAIYIFVMLRRPRSGSAENEFTTIFCIAAGCLFLAYLVQMKGWSYQLYPTSACLALAAGAFLSAALAPAPESAADRPKRRPAASAVATALIALVALVASTFWQGRYWNVHVDFFGPIVRKHAAGSSVYIFTTNLTAAFPMVNYTGVEWSSRFPSLWLLPGLEIQRRAQGDAASDERTAVLAEIERFLIDAVVSDLTRRPPALILVDVRENKPYFQGLRFDYIDHFSADPRFAEIWTGYELIADLGPYKAYKRRPEAAE